MELYRIHIILLFVSFAFATTVLIDGVTHLSMAKSDFADTPDGKAGWTNLLMYEIIVPVLSVFGLGMHIIGLHLDFVAYLPETATEGVFMVAGTAVHLVTWLIMGSLWTTCEVGTMTARKINASGQEPSIIVNRSGPTFCPQHKFLDGGYSLEGPIPKVKLAFAWLLFILTLVNLAIACRGWLEASHSQYMDNATMEPKVLWTDNVVEAPAKPPRAELEGKPVAAIVIGSYETKI